MRLWPGKTNARVSFGLISVPVLKPMSSLPQTIFTRLNWRMRWTITSYIAISRSLIAVTRSRWS